MKKLLAVSIIFLFFGISIIPSCGVQINNFIIKIYNPNDTLYVGGGGPGNFTKIQDAIDNASDGFLIYVFSGTYFEKVLVNKSVYLKGIDSGGGKPVIHGGNKGQVVKIRADNSMIDNFIVQNAGTKLKDYACIHIMAINCTISNNTCGKSSYTGIYIMPVEYANKAKIKHNNVENASYYGIYMAYDPRSGSKYMNLSYNTVINNPVGVELNGCRYNVIYRNNISYNDEGFLIRYGGNSEIIENIISNNKDWGLCVYQVDKEFLIKGNHVFSNPSQGIRLNQNYETKIIVRENTIENNKYGVKVLTCSGCIFFYNNFFTNTKPQIEEGGENYWFSHMTSGFPLGGNYWDDYTGKDNNGDGIGDTPYDIDGLSNDLLPLMEPYEFVPNAPSAPNISGPTVARVRKSINYFVISADPNGDEVYYYITWDDGNFDDWTGPYSSGEEFVVSHRWNKINFYVIIARAKDSNGLIGPWGGYYVFILPFSKPRSIDNPSFELSVNSIASANN